LNCILLKKLDVGRWPDRITGYATGVTPEPTGVKFTLDAIEELIGPEDTFVALPQGVMLNYLSKRENPSGFLNFLPSEVEMFGEEKMLQRLKSSSPRFILLVHTDSSDDGFRFFGQDYGFGIYSWIQSEYTPVRKIGAMPFREPEKFGILILKRNEPAGLSAHNP